MSTSTCNKTFSVYFPCSDSSVTYETEISDCVGFIENNIMQNCATVVIGDMNFQCSASSRGFNICNNVLSGYDIANCDDLLQCDDGDKFTYCNDSLGQYSFIDHAFVSSSLRDFISGVYIIDLGTNLSDHRPVSLVLSLPSPIQSCRFQPERQPLHSNWRWDKTPLADYQSESRAALASISVPNLCLQCNGCCDLSHFAAINQYYEI
jgi:hypothetical protein